MMRRPTQPAVPRWSIPVRAPAWHVHAVRHVDPLRAAV